MAPGLLRSREQWLEYVEQLRPSALSESVTWLWSAVDVWLSGKAAPPIAVPNERGTAIQLVWDSASHHASISLYASGGFSWLVKEIGVPRWSSGDGNIKSRPPVGLLFGIARVLEAK